MARRSPKRREATSTADQKRPATEWKETYALAPLEPKIAVSAITARNSLEVVCHIAGGLGEQQLETLGRAGAQLSDLMSFQPIQLSLLLQVLIFQLCSFSRNIKRIHLVGISGILL
jgi:hypothetical protein